MLGWARLCGLRLVGPVRVPAIMDAVAVLIVGKAINEAAILALALALLRFDLDCRAPCYPFLHERIIHASCMRSS